MENGFSQALKVKGCFISPCYFDKQRWYHRSYSAFGLFHRRRLQTRASDTGARAMTACPGEPARIGAKNCFSSFSEAKARASTVRPKIIPGRMIRHDRWREETFTAAPWRGEYCETGYGPSGGIMMPDATGMPKCSRRRGKAEGWSCHPDNTAPVFTIDKSPTAMHNVSSQPKAIRHVLRGYMCC